MIKLSANVPEQGDAQTKRASFKKIGSVTKTLFAANKGEQASCRKATVGRAKSAVVFAN
jgi:hypothetical protein